LKSEWRYSSIMPGRDRTRSGDPRGLFNRAAHTYERVGPPFFSHYGRRLVELVGVEPGSAVLDVATGAGAVFLPAAERVGDGGIVVEVDLAEDMVDRLRQEIMRRGLTNGQAGIMDAEELAFFDGSFGYVLCAFALDGLPDPDRALAHLSRVLRPGGRLGLTLSSRWWFEGDDRWRWHEEFLISLELQLHSGDSRFATAHEVESVLAAHHFQGISVMEDAFPLVFRDFEEWWRWGWSHGYRRVLEAMGEEELERYQESCAQELSVRATSRGIEGRLEVLLATAERA
jgi:O-methyltransferase/aklanonic acid methyltransferase